MSKTTDTVVKKAIAFAIRRKRAKDWLPKYAETKPKPKEPGALDITHKINQKMLTVCVRIRCPECGQKPRVEPVRELDDELIYQLECTCDQAVMKVEIV